MEESEENNPWNWDDDKFKEYLVEKSAEIRSFCDWEHSRPSATNEDSSTYNFGNRYRGLALILSNETFKDSNDDRHGSVKDRKELIKSFEKLEFHVIVFDDLTASQLREAAKVAARHYKHQEADCFVCAILSHGKEKRRNDGGKYHVIVGSDGVTVSTHDIIQTFQIKNLKKKPKLFFIQACRGRNYDDGVVSSETNQTRASGSTSTPDAIPVGEDPESNEPHPTLGELNLRTSGPESNEPPPVSDELNITMKIPAIPLYEDCLIMYATPPGYYAFRRAIEGSWFVQELCEFLQSDHVGTVPFLHGLTYVNDRVAEKCKVKKDDGTKCQMPVITTMLTKDIDMKKKTVVSVVSRSQLV